MNKDKITTDYCTKEMKPDGTFTKSKLEKMVDKVLIRLKFDVDYSEYYSFAEELLFIEVLPNYEDGRDFKGFLYSCLYKKFCTDMTGNTRDKRCNKEVIEEIDDNGNKIKKKIIIKDARLDAPINNNDVAEMCTLNDLIVGSQDVETDMFDDKEREEWSIKTKKFLQTLSPLQRKIILLVSENFDAKEICDELCITMQQYQNSIKRIMSDEKTKILKNN